MTQESMSSAANRLCKACGLCCDGSLFDVVVLTANDQPDRLPVLQLETPTQELLFRQPCSAFRNQCCSIYSERPDNCRSFKCELLKAIEAELIPWQTALALVEQMRTLADQMTARLQSMLQQQAPLAILLRQFNARLHNMDTVQRQQLDQHLLLELGTWNIMLKKHFSGKQPNTIEEGHADANQ